MDMLTVLRSKNSKRICAEPGNIHSFYFLFICLLARNLPVY